ncbi:MAG TPA: helix-turn-helix domain-containing protein, partial [Candidatus Eisenbacteria bacterium]
MSRHPIQYREFVPHLRLRPFVECYWRVWGTVEASPKPERVVPDACPEIIFHCANPFRRQIGARWIVQRSTFLAGTLSAPWRLKPGRRVDTVGVRFKPGMITAMFPVVMSEMADRETELESFVPAVDVATLLAQLRNATPARRVHLVDDWLLPRLEHRAPGGHSVTRTAVALLLQSRGRRRVDDVASRLAVPRRRLERLFARDLGIRPKLFARIARLNHALARLEREERDGAVDAALAAGYFDQSHMSREFRNVAGRR